MKMFGKLASRGGRKARLIARPSGSTLSDAEQKRQARVAVRAGMAVDWGRTPIESVRGTRLGRDPFQLLGQDSADDDFEDEKQRQQHENDPSTATSDSRQNGGRKRMLHEALDRLLEADDVDPRFRERAHRTLDGIIDQDNERIGRSRFEGVEDDTNLEHLKNLLREFFTEEQAEGEHQDDTGFQVENTEPTLDPEDRPQSDRSYGHDSASISHCADDWPRSYVVHWPNGRVQRTAIAPVSLEN